MSTATVKEYVMTYREGVMEKANASSRLLDRITRVRVMTDTIRRELAANLKHVQDAGLLQGLTIVHHIPELGVMHLSGPEESIKALETFVREKKVGEVWEKPAPPPRPHATAATFELPPDCPF